MDITVNSNKTTASFTSSFRLNSYGLSEAIKAIPPSILSLPAANTLLRVCSDACASSGYRLFKSLDTMCMETFQSENTVRSHLRQAVKAGILTKREVFKGGRQMTNEYTFTKPFLEAASQFRRCADTTKRSARDLFTTLINVFQKALLGLTNALFLTSKAAPQDLNPRGSKSCTQLSVRKDHENKIKLSEGEKAKSEIFNYGETPASQAVEHDAVMLERAQTRSADMAELQRHEEINRRTAQEIINKAAIKRSFGWMNKASGSNVSSQKSTPARKDHPESSFNRARFDRANRETEQEFQSRPSFETALAAASPHLEAIKKMFKKR